MAGSLLWRHSWLVVAVFSRWVWSQGDILDMDQHSVCGKEYFVSLTDTTLMWSSKVASSNPPLECIVFLTSNYTKMNGPYRLQIIVEALRINNCDINIGIFNGRSHFKNVIRSIGCTSQSKDIMYSMGRKITVRLTRPAVLNETENMFTFKVKTYGTMHTTTTVASPSTASSLSRRSMSIACSVLLFYFTSTSVIVA